ncbi:hypothetical protein [Pararhizobium arenae]|uniref:hypothetical protein n=1 Tax=Pararhizobium arenae TaxID=1856850 RepID=UPI00094AAD90|nr:hypothetical protein [Pararhizobium arenae]
MTNSFDGAGNFTPLSEPAPLVDEALAATDRGGQDREDVRALKAEVDRLQQAVRDTAAGAKQVAFSRLQDEVQSQPLTAAVVVGFLAFVYGLTR